MTAHEFFEKEMSGEPLTQESVEEGLKGFAIEVLEYYMENVESNINDCTNDAYKETIKTMLKW